MSRDEKRRPDYYDVDSYLEQAAKKPKPRPLWLRIIDRITDAFDPAQGFWIILLGLPMTFGLAIGLVMLGLKYGAIGFYGSLALVLSAGTYVLEKKFGKHLQVEDSPFVRRILTMIPAFLGVIGLFILVFLLAGKY